jgi:outer membrane protein assembly factor BamA
MLTTFAVLLMAAPFNGPQHVDHITIEGLWFSQELNVRRELTFAAGEDVTPEAWDLTEQRLWNLGVFSRVELQLREVDGKKGAVVIVEDRFPLGPIFRFNFGGEQFSLLAGAQHVNVLGRAQWVRAAYEYFAPYHGFHLSFSDPRLFNERVTGGIEAELLSRPQPDWGFSMRRAAVRTYADANFPGTITDRFRFGLRLEGNSDTIWASGSAPDAPPASSMAFFIGPFVRLGRLDTDRLRFAHGYVEIRGRFIPSTDPAYPFGLQADFDGQYFAKVGSRVNVGGRVLGGILRGVRPQDRTYVGGLDMVRGYKYSEFRAQGYGVANAELRVAVFDSTWFAVMPVAFVDVGFAHLDTGGVQGLASAGLGLRLFIPRLPRFGARVEVAVPFIAGTATSQFRPGINFGVGHYWF